LVDGNTWHRRHALLEAGSNLALKYLIPLPNTSSPKYSPFEGLHKHHHPHVPGQGVPVMARYDTRNGTTTGAAPEKGGAKNEMPLISMPCLSLTSMVQTTSK
jgi:hypothetical protein